MTNTVDRDELEAAGWLYCEEHPESFVGDYLRGKGVEPPYFLAAKDQQGNIARPGDPWWKGEYLEWIKVVVRVKDA